MTAYTVTATNSAPGGGNGINLQVEVITGALDSGGASLAVLNATLAAGSITPNFSSSYIAWAAEQGFTSGNFTIEPSNTAYSNVADSTDSVILGTGFYSGAVTGGTAVTVGASAPSFTSNSQLAAYELKPNPAWASDASTPANVQGTGTNTVTTASFTPPAGSILVAMVPGNFSATGGSGNISVTSSPVLTWTARAVNTAGSSGNGFAGVYIALIPSAATPAQRTQRARYRKVQALQRPGAAAVIAVPFIPPPLKGRPAASQGKTFGFVAPPPVIHPSVPSPFYPPHAPARGAQAARPGRLAAGRGQVPVPFVRGLILRGRAGIKGKTFGTAAPPPTTYPSPPIPQHALLHPAPHAAKGKTFGTAAPPPVIHPSVPSPFYPPRQLLRGAAAAVAGKLAGLRGRAGVPSPFRLPGLLKGPGGARKGQLSGLSAPPIPSVPSIPSPFYPPHSLLQPAPQAARRGQGFRGIAPQPVTMPGIPSPFYPPHSPLRPAPSAAAPGRLTRPGAGRPGVPAPFTPPHSPLRGAQAAAKGTLKGITAPPPVIHPSVPAPFYPPHSLLAGRPPVQPRTTLTGTAAPPPVIHPPATYLGIWQGATHMPAPGAAGNLIQGANHTGTGGTGDLKGDYERSGD
jgi:hypothetical protein